MTIENVVENLTKTEIRDLCFCLNNFGDKREGVVATPSSVKFYIKKYAVECIDNALNSGMINSDGAFYIQKLQMKLEEL
jgi:hypothetical protein